MGQRFENAEQAASYFYTDCGGTADWTVIADAVYAAGYTFAEAEVAAIKQSPWLTLAEGEALLAERGEA